MITNTGIRKNSRAILCLFVVIAVGLAISIMTPAKIFAADKKPVINFLLCPMGCGSLEGNQMLGNIIAKKDLPFTLNAQETPGYIYNLRQVAEDKSTWTNTIFSTEDDVVAIATHGGEPDVKSFFPEPVTTKWKILYGEGMCTAGHFFQTLDPNIKTMDDLKGKRIGLGLRTQSCWGMNAAINLLDGYGISEKNSKIFYLGPKKAAEELLNGKVDAIMIGFITNYDQKLYNLSGISHIIEASGRQSYYIAPSLDVYEKINKQFGAFTVPVHIPPKTMPSLNTEFTVGGDRVYNVAHPSFPDELAYEMVKAVATYGPTLQNSHAYWKVVTPLDMLNGLSEENTHPGAIKAFKELGIWDKRTTFAPTEVEVFK
jgi:uncharacterized protein